MDSKPTFMDQTRPEIEAFFHPVTCTWSYVVMDPTSDSAAIIDPVLDYDPAAGRASAESADAIIDFVKRRGLTVEWILETHVHADHLSGASYLKDVVGGRTGIGEHVTQVQQVFGELFNAEPDFARDGSQFDHLFRDGETLTIGALQASVWHTPGHTPACVTYVFDGAAFVGDTIFMPDYGTARTDFPGGDARTLYRSIRRILSLPEDTELYLCHDYETEGRSEFCYRTTVREERAKNIHMCDAIDEDGFVSFREARDAELAAPRLLLPSVQFNMRGAAFPPPEDNGMRYLKIPVRPVERHHASNAGQAA
jgi:glyoxylase-like metal-dependent hydrolase (beta-lactamase superfamily II)